MGNINRNLAEEHLKIEKKWGSIYSFERTNSHARLTAKIAVEFLKWVEKHSMEDVGTREELFDYFMSKKYNQ